MLSKSSSTSQRAESLGNRPFVEPIVRQTLIERSIRKRTVEDLSDDCLKLVFSEMTLKQKFAIERVSKRWKTLVNEKLLNHTGFIVGSNPVENHLWVQENHCSLANGIHYSKDQIEDTNKVWLEMIAIKCPKIKCIAFRIDMNEKSIEYVEKLFPTLECIHLNQHSYPFKNHIRINDGLKIANLFSRTIKHLSINCKDISGECLFNLTSNLPLLEELEIIKFDETLEHIFSRLREGIKTISVVECIEFGLNAIKALIRGKNSGITCLQIRCQLDMDRLLPLICKSFQNLKDLKIGYIPHRSQQLPHLVLLSQLTHLEINFFKERPFNWAQMIYPMPSLKSFHIICGELSGRVLIEIRRIMPNMEKLEISFAHLAFRCTCHRNERMGCSYCLFQTYTQLSRLPLLRQIRFNGFTYSTRERVIKKFKTIVKNMPLLNNNPFPALQWIQICWKLFPRPFKRPLFDGLVYLAKRNPERVIILETGIGLCRCHSSKLKSGWLSAIGSKRLSKIPANIKLMFFRDIPFY